MSPADIYALTGMALFVLGAAGTVLRAHLIRRILALNIMGSGAFVVLGALAARGAGEPGPDPVPQALVITGIVVTVAMTALALALLVRLRTETGRLTIDVPSPDGAAKD